MSVSVSLSFASRTHPSAYLVSFVSSCVSHSLSIQLCYAHFSGLVLSFCGRLTTESDVCFGLFPPLMRRQAQQHVENPSLGETVSDFDIYFQKEALATAQKCASLSLCSALVGVFSCGPLFVTHVSLSIVFRDFGAGYYYFARR